MRGYRHVAVVIDNFSNYGRTVPLKIKDSLENIATTSKRKPDLIESDLGSEFVNRTFSDLLNKNKIQRNSRYTSLGNVFAERFNRTVKDLLEKLVFPKEMTLVGLIF